MTQNIAEIDGKLFKFGHSYAIIVPKALINCRVIDPEKNYLISIKSKELKNGNKTEEQSDAGFAYSDLYFTAIT